MISLFISFSKFSILLLLLLLLLLHSLTTNLHMYSNCVILLNRDFVVMLAFEYAGHFGRIIGFWNSYVVECLDDETMMYFSLLICDIA
jgi:hypothetical protein